MKNCIASVVNFVPGKFAWTTKHDAWRLLPAFSAFLYLIHDLYTYSSSLVLFAVFLYFQRGFLLFNLKFDNEYFIYVL